MKERKGPELTKVEQKEKALTSMQFKLLDIARPLLFVSESLAADKTDANLDVQDACSDSIRLLGHAFASITAKRRENILKFTDPRFESLLKEPERFDLDESDELFGRSFLRSMVQDADNDAKLRIVNRASNSVQRQSGHSGPSGSSHHHGREGGRHSASSNFPSGSNRGGFNNNFSGKGYVNPSTSLFCDLGYVGGRVRFDADFWPTLTNDQWVIRSVSEGVRIPFVSFPSVPFTQSNMGMSAELEAICDTEVQSLLQKKAIEIVPETELCFVSGLFVIPKRTGGYRPIVNLKNLNRYIEYHHFKMEGVQILKDTIRPLDFFTKIDLKDAYLTVPIFHEHKKFLQIKWKGVLYQFTCLCFGLASAPWSFTKLLKPVVAFCRKRGIRLIIYLDDILILNESKIGAERDFELVVSILERCGFLINHEKSIGVASRKIEYLGLIVDSHFLSLSLLEEKVASIVNLCEAALKTSLVSLRDIAKLLGNFAWAIQAIPFAQAHYRSLQRVYISESERSRGDLQIKVPLSAGAKDDLLWWVRNVAMANGKPMTAVEPDLILFSDACLTGWGAVLNSSRARGPWTSRDSSRHINELELMAALHALESFASEATKISVRIMMDNVTAVNYVNKAGGTKSASLNDISQRIIAFCEIRSISLHAVYLPGSMNHEADFQSRARMDASDWMLDPAVFSRISCRWILKIDLFASAWNRQLEAFVSWHPQPSAKAIDAFSMDWQHLQAYAFPPFALIQRCLGKIRRDQAELTLVAPYWPTQPWFPSLLELACEMPLVIRQTEGLLAGPTGIPHPLLVDSGLLLTVWRLSGVITRQEEFRTESSDICWPQTVPPHLLHTKARGTLGLIGVLRGTRIPCLLL
jgi:ribonuclease HI